MPGLFAGTIGVRRLLKMFERYNIKTTWFIPGHSLETFPEECRMIADAGHEIGTSAICDLIRRLSFMLICAFRYIGLHGYSHENPIAMTLEQQTAIMDKVSVASDHCHPNLVN
jgi:peptidoglycan/xylan/chitin deacetylase (PgdA/CDA1 family)